MTLHGARMFAFTIPAQIGLDWLDGHANDLDLLAAGPGPALFIGRIDGRKELARAIRLAIRHGGPVYWNQGNQASAREYWPSETNGTRCRMDPDAIVRAAESTCHRL